MASAPVQDRHALVERLREQMPQLSVRKLCQVVGINRQWYYQRRRASEHCLRDEQLCQAITALRETFAGYGYRRMTKALARAGWKVNHKRVWRVMRQADLTCRLKRHRVRTTDSDHSYYTYPNLIKGNVFETPNSCWQADLTYVRLPEGFVYLACILDACSRKCVGWSLSRHMDTQLPLRALEMALATRQVEAGLIHHSDRGRQYCSATYVRRLLEIGAQVSMSAPGRATENALAESFFKTVKYEEVYVHQYRTFEEAQSRLQTFLEDVYNTKRLHSSLGYVPPDEFETMRCSLVDGMHFLGALHLFTPLNPAFELRATANVLSRFAYQNPPSRSPPDGKRIAGPNWSTRLLSNVKALSANRGFWSIMLYPHSFIPQFSPRYQH